MQALFNISHCHPTFTRSTIGMGNYIKYFLGTVRNNKQTENSIDQIKEALKNQGGGSVDLTLGEDGVAILVINNPEKRNAMSGKMMVEMSEAITTLEKWTNGKGLLIHGAGVGFCSGGDLDVFRKSKSPTLGADMSQIITDALNRLRSLPIVSLAYVHGFGAIGGGSEIALAADFRVMSPGSKIGFVHGKMGLTPAWGGASRLVKVVGYEKALEILVTAKLISSEDARDMGVVHKCGDLNFADNYLRSLCVLAPTIIGAIKSALVNDEHKVFVSLFGEEENKKALAAHLKHTE